MAIEDATNPMQGVSGPGPYAKRTDLKYKSQSYGDGVAYEAAKSGAPLETAPKSPMLSQAPKVSNGMSAGVGLFDPTQRPNEPVTAGIDMGDGVGSNALMMQSKFAERKLSDILAEMIPYDSTGEVQYLYQNALSRGQ